jgi:ribosomal protein L13
LREFDLPTLYGTYNPHKNIGANVIVFEAAKVTRAFAGDLATSVPNVSWESCLHG